MRQQETSTADHIVLTPEKEEEEFQRCLNENAAWNALIASERNVRLANEREAKVAYVQERLDAYKLSQEERIERADKRIQYEIQQSKTFITHENLDEAIEVALANPVDYNYGIDMAGNLYKGRATQSLNN